MNAFRENSTDLCRIYEEVLLGELPILLHIITRQCTDILSMLSATVDRHLTCILGGGLRGVYLRVFCYLCPCMLSHS